MAKMPTAAPFIMHGARAAMATGMPHIEEVVKGIERAVAENTGLAFDLARTLIESACRTIIAERGIAFSPDDDLPKLFKIATTHLPFLPVSASDAVEVRRSLAQTLGGLHTAVRGVCELRNACGFASHGSDGSRPVMEAVQALLAAETADAIVGFLYRVHCQEGALQPTALLEYDDNPDFNDYIDQDYEPVRILNSEFRPSEVLYRMEPETYRIALAEYKTEPVDGKKEAVEPEASETKP